MAGEETARCSATRPAKPDPSGRFHADIYCPGCGTKYGVYLSVVEIRRGVACPHCSHAIPGAEQEAEERGRSADPGAVKLPFGKYKGRTLRAILDSDPMYYVWLAGMAEIQSEGLRRAVQELAEQHGEALSRAASEERQRMVTGGRFRRR